VDVAISAMQETRVRSGRDDKGEGGDPIQSGCLTPFNIWQLFSMEASLPPLSFQPKRSEVERWLCGCSFLESQFAETCSVSSGVGARH
jgi:hypothetical protein